MSRSSRILWFSLAWVIAGCTSRPAHTKAPAGGCSHNHEVPPLNLTAEDRRLIATVSETPKTALDYYMRLPKSYFSIMPDSKERRVTYVERATLSDDYLHATRWFECDGGGFEVTLKLYHTPAGTFIAIKDTRVESIFKGDKGTGGEPPVHIERPSLWRYPDGHWTREPDDAIPKIPAQFVLRKYHHDWDADRQYTAQQKFIEIDYKLSPSVEDIVLMGRENFQSDIYEYGRLRWNGTRFTFVKTGS